jgi:hypothetical protein
MVTSGLVPGPILSVGGMRRLNVAVTLALEFRPQPIPMQRTTIVFLLSGLAWQQISAFRGRSTRHRQTIRSWQTSSILAALTASSSRTWSEFRATSATASS